MTKICPSCGTQNPDNAVFCIKCGYRFIDQQVNQQTNVPQTNIQQNPMPPPVPQQSMNPQPQARGSTLYIWVVLSLVFSIISVLVFLSLTLGNLISLILGLMNGTFLVGRLIFLIFFVILFIGSIILLTNVMKIYDYFKINDLQSIRNKLTTEFIVISFIFGLIITGVFIMLLQLDLEGFFINTRTF
ncbi:MAG: zinc-ribbon domain-containing protein [Thermoplasmata archaeon]